MGMNLTGVQQAWNELAARDAMWAVLTGPHATAREWDSDTFFRTGVAEIESVLDRVRRAGVVPRFHRALDFGCGVGRLTQALGQHFERADGVDISSAMIERARELNQLGDRCHYHQNESERLAGFADGTFDFVYSMITLQHLEPRYSRGYVKEFFRVAKPGGVVVFQLPGEMVTVPRPRTRSSEPLPRRACRAVLNAPAVIRCAPAATLPLRIMVRNAGTHTWPAMAEEDGRYAVRLGNHWRNRFRWMLRRDDQRTELAHDLAPGESLEIGINPVAPAKPGHYLLEFDMVQELVRWFASAGSRRARTRVHVDPTLAPGEMQGQLPQIEMHGVPRQDVETLIAECGGILLAVDDNDAPGPGWTSYRYIARV
jgi:SAM-dependent methyltransferase